MTMSSPAIVYQSVYSLVDRSGHAHIWTLLLVRPRMHCVQRNPWERQCRTCRGSVIVCDQIMGSSMAYGLEELCRAVLVDGEVALLLKAGSRRAL